MERVLACIRETQYAIINKLLYILFYQIHFDIVDLAIKRLKINKYVHVLLVGAGANAIPFGFCFQTIILIVTPLSMYSSLSKYVNVVG